MKLTEKQRHLLVSLGVDRYIKLATITGNPLNRAQKRRLAELHKVALRETAAES